MYMIDRVNKQNPFRRPGEPGQRTGRRFKIFWSKFFGVAPTRGSGNLWWLPLDLDFARFHFSLKYSARDRLRFGRYMVKDLLREADGARRNDTDIGLLATYGDDDGEVYVVMRGTDFLRMVQTVNFECMPPSRGEQKRQRAKIPALLRKEDEDA